jgi:hypothetical protein
VLAVTAAALGASYCNSDPNPAPITSNGSDSCPKFLDFELDGTHSIFKPGWTGFAHGAVAVDDRSRFTLAASCDDQCRRCALSGPVRGTGAVLQRCLTDFTQTCGGSGDKTCPGGDADNCRFTLPPIESDVIGNITCNASYFDAAPGDGTGISGTIDLETGETDFVTMKLKELTATASACPTCEGDPTPNDGLAQGTCTDPATHLPNGVACDTQGFKVNGLSLDCPIPFGPTPHRTSLVANHASTATHVWTLDASHPACKSGSWTGNCWCGACADAAHEGCNSDLDCSPGVTCGSGMTGGYMLGDNDCPGLCGSDGRCTTDPTIDCFPDAPNSTLAAYGSAAVTRGGYQITLANIVCMLPNDTTGDPVSGVPGPLWFEAAFTITPRSQ